jgi:hypothetical protein
MYPLLFHSMTVDGRSGVMSTTDRKGIIGRRVEFCDGCGRVTNGRSRSYGIVEAARMQAVRLTTGMFR